MEGYKSKIAPYPVKRFCRTMELKDDNVLIAEYIKRHSSKEAWPEIREEMRSIGIWEMEIYIHGNRLFMIVETPLDFDWDTMMAKLSCSPRQQKWEDYMAVFQQCKKGDTSVDKWKMMERIFHFYE